MKPVLGILPPDMMASLGFLVASSDKEDLDVLTYLVKHPNFADHLDKIVEMGVLVGDRRPRRTAILRVLTLVGSDDPLVRGQD